MYCEWSPIVATSSSRSSKILIPELSGTPDKGGSISSGSTGHTTAMGGESMTCRLEIEH